MVTSKTRITLDDLLALSRVEVIDGELIEMSPVGGTHHFIARNVFRLLDAYVVEHDLGEVFFDGLIFILDRDAETLKGSLVPDVSFVSKAHIPAAWEMELPFPGAPDLAVEVISPNDDPEKLRTRIQRYLQFGTEQVWVLYPRQRELHLIHKDQPDTIKIYDKTFQPGSLLPGLEIIIMNLFVLPGR